MKLYSLADQIYAYDFEVDIMLGMIFPTRTTIFKLNSGELMIYSPGPLNEELVKEIKKLGEVKHLVAPNLFHHIHFRKAQIAFPNAKSWVPRGLNQKKKKKPLENVETYNSFEDLGLIEDFEGLVLTHHTYLRELCLLHKKSGQLIVTDFCFNHSGNYPNWQTKLIFKLAGADKGLKQSKMIRKSCKYPTEFLNDCHSLFKMAENAKGLIMAHGNPLTEEEFQIQWNRLKKEVIQRFS